MDPKLVARLDRIDKKLNALAVQAKKETWISPSWLKKLTGWDREEMRQAREQNIIEYKASEGGGWVYKLESIPDIFIKKQTA